MAELATLLRCKVIHFNRFIHCRIKYPSSIRKINTYYVGSDDMSNEKETSNQISNTKENSSSKIAVFPPICIKPVSDENNIGSELVGTLKKSDILKILNTFKEKKEFSMLCIDYGMDEKLKNQALKHFHKYCLDSKTLPVDLHIIFYDISQGALNPIDIFPYFLRYTKQAFPHMNCLEDLKKISDLRSPANWYSIARSKPRKIVFHTGPTNSGKTYHALKRFMAAKSGIYCGPLKLLVVEIYNKCNEKGTPCDLITGEERKYAHKDEIPANHVSCTVEMASVTNVYEVAVIDEIQLMRDPGRGWAWTRALLGIAAEEIHLCGETAAIDLIQSICATTCEEVEIHKYERLTELRVEEQALGFLTNVEPGDCIVCFSKHDIYSVSQKIESIGIPVAVIYGSLPPSTKLAQAAKFNDPKNPCKVLVATDAIGMGLNLHIRRIIFYSLTRLEANEKGEREMKEISVSSALQIAGRAGRYGTQWDKGYVTTFKPDDLQTLKKLLSQTPEPLTQAGLHPTAEQIELYAYHLPQSSFSNLMDIFISLSRVDNSLYFICDMEDFKFLADMIQHIPLPLRARYVFCCAPINRKLTFLCGMFVKFARRYSKNDSITFTWLSDQIGWPFSETRTLLDLVHLESVFDVLDLYLWLSYRFMDLFPDAEIIRNEQTKLDSLISDGVIRLTALLKNSTSGMNNIEAVRDDSFEMSKHKNLRENRSVTSTIFRRGKLTSKLLSEGLLTSDMLQTLQREWSEISRRSSKNRK
ncbi:ATP-dependent RNA helicase SUV3 homolog, mitochondrial [Prorops nasuta]|uniref:ATP-dependent RNA helicase SUV3 homolog, mitochondrial n=2 Tax=Prorops nasuta TaxID=863751 RepID=UPI0034D00A47